jgi:hypothetical protein
MHINKNIFMEDFIVYISINEKYENVEKIYGIEKMWFVW